MCRGSIYSLRSCSMKASASSSLVSLGTRLVIDRDLPLMHVAGADRPQERAPAPPAQRERQEDVAPADSLAGGDQPILVLRVPDIGQDQHRPAGQGRLDLLDRNPVLLAFGPVATIPLAAFQSCRQLGHDTL